MPASPATAPGDAASPRWLDDDEQAPWRSFLDVLRLLTDRLDRDLQTQSGIPHGYYEILVRLSEAPERRLRMSTLAENSISSRSRVSHAVARLEEMGWVRREECASDRRGQLAVLTDEGYAVLAAAAPGHVESVRRHVFDQLSPAEVGQLRAISDAIRDHLAPDGPGVPCPNLTRPPGT
jgi:DNA-binding MarR family transcriptional regulator